MEQHRRRQERQEVRGEQVMDTRRQTFFVEAIVWDPVGQEAAQHLTTHTQTQVSYKGQSINELIFQELHELTVVEIILDTAYAEADVCSIMSR